MSETENILQTIKTTVQDLVAPDVREMKVRMASMEDQNKVHFEALRSQFDNVKAQADAQFKAIMAAISQSKAESDLSAFKQIAALSERVAALEGRSQ